MNKQENEKQEVFLGLGWENEKGINISINVPKFEEAIRSGELEKNQYNDVRLFIGKRKEVHERSKATHFVKPSKHKK